MLRRPTNVTRRRVAAHACPECRRLWALSGSRVPSGAWVIACSYCGWHDVRGGGRSPASGHGEPADGAARPAPRARSHDVVLHAGDDRLVAVLEEYLVAGWAGGETGLVIATAEHRTLLRERLVARGLAGQLGEGRYVELDAARTLEQLMAEDGSPDAQRFERTVGSLVRDHAADGPLRGFGEMVDVLWAAGNAAGAVRLEELWTDLQDDVPFLLLCAYAEAHVDEADRATLRRTHDHVLA